MICDDLHVHPAAQKLAYQMKGRDGLILVTDSLRACLQGDGESSLGGQKVFVKNGEARLADGTLAASIAPMNEVVLHFLINSGASIPDVVAMATVNPAKASVSTTASVPWKKGSRRTLPSWTATISM